MDENIQLKAAISAMNAPCEHQWDNVMVSDDHEDYICRKCMAHGMKVLGEGGGLVATQAGNKIRDINTSPRPVPSPAKPSWTCPDCCVNPCSCELLSHEPIKQSEIRDDKDYIITLQKQRIKSLEQSIGLAANDYYDKLDEEGDCELWHHPLMGNLMSVLARDGYTPMSKNTQICLVKAALRSMPEPVSVSLERCARAACVGAGWNYTNPTPQSISIAKAVLDAAGVKYVED